VKFQAIISDASHATQWVKNNISQYNGDDQNIFLMGHSAGAHLAIMLSMKESYLKADTYATIKGELVWLVHMILFLILNLIFPVSLVPNLKPLTLNRLILFREMNRLCFLCMGKKIPPLSQRILLT